MNSEVLNLELMIRKPPESVRAWWTDYPDDYHAKDPREQPYRILTTRRLPNGREVRTYWRLPDGSTPELQEVLNLKPDGSWTYELPYPNPTGIHVFDEFRTEPTPNGTRLLIHSTLTPRDPAASETEARQAIELNPSFPDAYRILSNVAFFKGDGDEGIRLWEAAYHLDPVRPRYVERLGSLYFYMGRESEALQFWDKTAQLAPAGTYRNMTEYYLIKGNLEKAREFNAKFEKLEPTNPRVTWMGGVIAAMEGDRERALLAIRKIEDAKVGPLSFNYIGYVYHALGDLDSYFEYMNKALEAHTLIPSVMMYSPLLARARADPRYLELMEKIRRQLGLTK